MLSSESRPCWMSRAWQCSGFHRQNTELSTPEDAPFWPIMGLHFIITEKLQKTGWKPQGPFPQIYQLFPFTLGSHLQAVLWVYKNQHTSTHSGHFSTLLQVHTLDPPPTIPLCFLRAEKVLILRTFSIDMTHFFRKAAILPLQVSPREMRARLPWDFYVKIHSGGPEQRLSS